MKRALSVMLMLALAGAALRAAAPAAEVAIEPANRLEAGAPAWRDLAAQFAERPDTLAEFEERRYFPIRAEPVVLKGEVRVSQAHGLSLRYTAPEQRVVVLDERGMLLRDAAGGQSAPDPRAVAANRALLHVLRLDFAALAPDFDVYGRRDGAAWAIALVPRDGGTRRAVGTIHVAGEATAVRAIAFRRSPKQHIDIAVAAPRATAAFTAEELKAFFR